MRRRQYLLPRQSLSTKNNDTLQGGQQHLQVFAVSRAKPEVIAGQKSAWRRWGAPVPGPRRSFSAQSRSFPDRPRFPAQFSSISGL